MSFELVPTIFGLCQTSKKAPKLGDHGLGRFFDTYHIWLFADIKKSAQTRRPRIWALF